jgi:hypothetical protein
VFEAAWVFVAGRHLVEDRVGKQVGPPSGKRNGVDGVAVGAKHDGRRGHGLEFFGGGPGGVAGDEPELVDTYSGGWFVVIVSPYDVFRREITIKGSFAEINSFPSAWLPSAAGELRPTASLPTASRSRITAKGSTRDKTAHKVIIVL